MPIDFLKVYILKLVYVYILMPKKYAPFLIEIDFSHDNYFVVVWKFDSYKVCFTALKVLHGTGICPCNNGEHTGTPRKPEVE